MQPQSCIQVVKTASAPLSSFLSMRQGKRTDEAKKSEWIKSKEEIQKKGRLLRRGIAG